MLTVVAGLGRCGTSMMMSMLAAGGVPVTGSAPDYEVDRVSQSPIDVMWLRSLGDSVVKVLDPHRVWPRHFPARFIWMDRNAKEQARSQRKFLRAIGYSARSSALAAALRKDRARSLLALAEYTRLLISFEEAINAPLATAERLRIYFPEIDVNAAAATVLARSPCCAPDLSIEIAQIKKS